MTHQWYPETHAALELVRDIVVAGVNHGNAATAEPVPQPAPTNPESPEAILRHDGLPYLVVVTRLWDWPDGSLGTEPAPAERPRARYAGPRPRVERQRP